MAEPLTLTAVGAVAITEGIKFLYGQAGEILKRWRDRKDAASEEPAPAQQPEPVAVTLPPAFEGQLTDPQIHFDKVQELEAELRDLRRALNDYVDDIEPVDVEDRDLLQTVDALRTALEAIYGERLTFKGEQRPPSGTKVDAEIAVQTVAGYAAAVRAKRITDAEVRARAKADRVEQGGQFIGVDVDEIGGSRSSRREPPG